MANIQDFIARITEDNKLMDQVKAILQEKGLNTDALEKKLSDFAAKLGFKLSGEEILEKLTDLFKNMDAGDLAETAMSFLKGKVSAEGAGNVLSGLAGLFGKDK